MSHEIPSPKDDQENYQVDPKAPQEGIIKYELLKQRHPEYTPKYWRRTRAFYAGGEKLLGDKELLKEVFPQHVGEPERIYKMRVQSAHYINYAGEIVDHFMAKLAKDPLRFGLMSDDTPEQFYLDFEKDCTPGNDRFSFDELVRHVVLESFQTRRGYVLVDMAPRPEGEYANRADQEAAGGLNVWCVPLPAECLVDWERDEDGEFLWALVCKHTTKRGSLKQVRGKVREEYTLYTRDEWLRWVVEYDKGEEPKPKQPIPLSEGGKHSFGRVPVLSFELPEGLFAMGKLESVAKEHFNKRNALSWAESKALLPVLYEFHENDPVSMAMSGDQGDADRAFGARGPGKVQVRLSGDRVEWVAPKDAPFTHALASCDSLRDEMHRVEHQMAMAADTRGALIRRSGESKKSDEKSTIIIMDAIGDLTRDYAHRVLEAIAEGRQDGELDWKVSGMRNFESVDQGGILEQESMLDSAVDIPSATFKRIRKFQVAKSILGDTASAEDIEEVKAELEEFFSPEAEKARQAVEFGFAEAFDPNDEADGDLGSAELSVRSDTPEPGVDPGGVTFSSDPKNRAERRRKR